MDSEIKRYPVWNGNINAMITPHQDQRYETIGDWWFSEDGTLQVRISDMVDKRYVFLVEQHEIQEALLCYWNGVEEDSVTQFDMEYEAKRQPGDNTEPGDQYEAPYHKYHQVATTCERLSASLINVDWDVYDHTMEQLLEPAKERAKGDMK